MRRIFAFAVCGLGLSACTSADLFKIETAPVTLRLESQPPGAQATVSSGGSCRTPCSLPVPAVGEVSVTYALDGYEPVEAAVQIVQPVDPREGTIRANPNPVYVELDALPQQLRRRAPAPRRPAAATAKRPATAKKPAAKKSTAKKPASAKKPATKRTAPPPPQQPAAAPPPASAAPAPAGAAPPPPASTQSSPWPPAPGQPPQQQQQQQQQR
jgi:hypothetical protein